MSPVALEKKISPCTEIHAAVQTERSAVLSRNKTLNPIRNISLVSDRSLGLYIRGVEEESRSRKEGLFQEDECIVRINTTDLMDKTFGQ